VLGQAGEEDRPFGERHRNSPYQVMGSICCWAEQRFCTNNIALEGGKATFPARKAIPTKVEFLFFLGSGLGSDFEASFVP